MRVESVRHQLRKVDSRPRLLVPGPPPQILEFAGSIPQLSGGRSNPSAQESHGR
jgi:hypothetical protein